MFRLQTLEDRLFRWLSRRRLHRGGLRTNSIPSTFASNSQPQRQSAEARIFEMPALGHDDLIAASLHVVPCPVCDSDAPGISGECIERDPIHCDVCDLNWPSRIAIGNRVLGSNERGLG
jgi:hypothetical protein